MHTDDFPSCSGDTVSPQTETKEVEENAETPVDSSEDDVPSKRIRLISTSNGAETNKNSAGKGLPLSPSFKPFDLPPFQARRVTERETTVVRGGHPRVPFIRASREESVEEKLISGEEEMHRITMERVLKEHNLLKGAYDKITDMDIISRDLMRKFRNPREWNSLEVQLLLDQFDVQQPLKDYVKEQDLDGLKMFSLELNEVLVEFPFLTDDPWDGTDSYDFNEKIFFYGFVDRIKKIIADESMVYTPPPFNVVYNN